MSVQPLPPMTDYFKGDVLQGRPYIRRIFGLNGAWLGLPTRYAGKYRLRMGVIQATREGS